MINLRDQVIGLILLRVDGEDRNAVCDKYWLLRKFLFGITFQEEYHEGDKRMDSVDLQKYDYSALTDLELLAALEMAIQAYYKQ